jgi:hypothetical protein
VAKRAAVDLERRRQHAAQVGQRALAHRGGHGAAELREHVAVVKDGVERVVRRQRHEPALPLLQLRARLDQHRRQASRLSGSARTS